MNRDIARTRVAPRVAAADFIMTKSATPLSPRITNLSNNNAGFLFGCEIRNRDRAARRMSRARISCGKKILRRSAHRRQRDARRMMIAK